MVNIKVKRLTETATLPVKAHKSDACYDLFLDAPNDKFNQVVFKNATPVEVQEVKGIKIPPQTTIILGTGIATEIPEGYVCYVYGRSGMGCKRSLRPANCVGVIDAGYRDEWFVALTNDGYEEQIVHHGDRIAQFTIEKVEDSYLTEVAELGESERTGGLGSTGN